LAAATCAAAKPGSGTWIYALGGSDGNQNVATVEAYDTTKKKWTPIPPMPTERGFLAATSHNNLLYALGGGDNTTLLLDAHAVFNPATNAWSQLPPMPTGRMGHAAVTGSDGLIYTIGGAVGAPSFAVVATVEAYNPRSGHWSTKAPMLTPRAALSAVALPNGKIYAIGGCNQAAAPSGPNLLSSVEVFDVATNTWTSSPYSLPVPTKYAAAALGSNGLIYLMGGWDMRADYDASVWSFDPSGTGWRRQAPLLSGGTGALATATGPDGLVYAIGGSAPPAGSLAVTGDVEAYTYDKCDYIEYEIQGVEQQIAALRSDLPELPPQALAGARKQLISLGQQVLALEKVLQACRQ
jgi:N-acetylneuraminic acid mutarotase